MSEENPSYQQIRYNEYSKQRAELTKTTVELAGRYDQWILTLSAGALGLSVAFLEKIVPHPEPNTLFLLGLAWSCLIAGLFAGFVALQTAQYSALRQIEILDADYRTYLEELKKGNLENPVGDNPKLNNRFNAYTDLLNKISAPAFVLGVIFLCVFAYANIPSVNPTPSLPPKVDVNVRFQNQPTPPEPSRTATNKP